MGVTSIQMVVEGVDGVHTMDFSSFECAGSFVQWKDYDNPWKTSEFMLAREARCHGHHPPIASSQAYPRHQDIVRFENPTRPALPLGWSAPMAWSVVLPITTPIHSMPCLLTPQIQISLARSQLPSAHPYHGYLDGPISGPLWLALIFLFLSMHGDTIPPTLGIPIHWPWINSTKRSSSLTQQCIYPSSLPVPNSLTVL